MEAIRADHQVEAAPARVFEIHPHALGVLVEVNNPVAKQDLGEALDLAEKQSRKIAPREADEAPAGQLIEDARAEPGHALAAPSTMRSSRT